MRWSLSASVPTRSSGCDPWNCFSGSFSGRSDPYGPGSRASHRAPASRASVLSGFDPYRGCPAGLVASSSDAWLRGRRSGCRERDQSPKLSARAPPRSLHGAPQPERLPDVATRLATGSQRVLIAETRARDRVTRAGVFGSGFARI